MSWFYYISKNISKLLMRMILRLFTNWQVRGKENVPKVGAVIVVANHLNNADPPLLGVSLKRKMIFMAKEELFRSRFSRCFIRSFGAFPVQRGKLDRKALRQADKALTEGLALVMFPEGARSKDAQLQPAFHGSALIASRCGVPILPIGITGTEKIKGLAWLLRRPAITVNIGHAFNLPPVDGRLTKATLTELTSIVMKRIAELLPPEYQESYIEQGKSDGIKD